MQPSAMLPALAFALFAWLTQSLETSATQLLRRAREASLDARRRAESRKLAEESLTAATRENDLRSRAGATLLLSRLASMDGRYEEAERLASEAAGYSRAISDLRGVTEAALAVGTNRLFRHRYDEGIAALRQGLETAPETDIELRGRAMQNLGSAYWSKGEAEQALFYGEKALALRRQAKDAYGIALGEQLLASAYFALGDLQNAQLRFAAARDRWRELRQQANVADATDGLGISSLAAGDAAAARRLHEEALALWTAAGSKAGQGQALNNLGMVALRQRRLEEAGAYLTRAHELAAGNSRALAYTLHNLGHLHAMAGRHRQAVEALEDSLERSRELGDAFSQARSLYRLGLSQIALGQREQARRALDAALVLQQRHGDRDGESLTLTELARLEKDRNHLEAAEARAREAIQLVEQTRSTLASPELRANYLDARYRQYDLWIEILLRRQRIGEAFEAAERARARSLLDSLADWTPRLDGDVDTQRLVARASQLERRLRAQVGAGARVAPDPRRTAALLAEYVEARSLVRASRQASIYDPPEPLRLAAIQERLLDRGTALVAFWAGETSLYAWVVTGRNVRGAALGPAGPVMTQVSRLGSALTARVLRPDGETLAARRERVQAADAQRQALAVELSRRLLAPFRAEIGAAERLLIVPDSALHSLPFALLEDPAMPGAPLVANRTLVVLPSASVLSYARQQHSSRANPTRWRAAALVNPAYGGALPALPHTVREADALPRALRLVGAAASRDALGLAAVRSANLLHFGAHAILDVEQPLSSSLVLSLRDASGAAVDGYLRLHAIHDLRLRPQLVVLSACRSSSGAQLRGEGVMSLARSFLYAGAARVVASLWDVEDQATADLMADFYRRLLVGGLSPAGALGGAQREMASRGRRPDEWAAFQLHGEPR